MTKKSSYRSRSPELVESKQEHFDGPEQQAHIKGLLSKQNKLSRQLLALPNTFFSLFLPRIAGGIYFYGSGGMYRDIVSKISGA